TGDRLVTRCLSFPGAVSSRCGRGGPFSCSLRPPLAMEHVFLRGVFMAPLGLSATMLACLLLVGTGCNSKSDKPSADVAASSTEPAPRPLFDDVTDASGVSFTYRNGEETANHLAILEAVGGGVALLDYDGDGLLDIF